MTKNNQKNYKKATKDLTKAEIAESIVIPNSKSISKKNHQAFLEKRLNLMKSRTKDEITISSILQFKYEVEMYLELGKFDSEYSFSNCLKRYMQIINRSSKDLTEELSIHKTKLSRILNDREDANLKLGYKLEKHSGQLLPVLFWWKLILLKKEDEIISNKKARKEASRNIKSVVKLKGKVYG